MEDIPLQSCGWDRCDRSDLFVVPAISFRLLYGLLIVGHGRRQIVWLGVTAHPTSEWIANQITEAFGWKRAPCYLIRDRDRAYGNVFIRGLRSMGQTSPRSRWQNGCAERLIGSIRPECLDHVVVFGNNHSGQSDDNGDAHIVISGLRGLSEN